MTLLVGHVTREIVSEMTYSVSSGTLNSTIPIPMRYHYVKPLTQCTITDSALLQTVHYHRQCIITDCLICKVL